jgi:beta-carotene ketolase (CrtO type)
MGKEYDALVIGAGHNGLACACYLAKAGFKTAVLEKNSQIGGMARTEEIAGPGFRSDMHAYNYQLASLCPAPDELNLFDHGLEIIAPEIQIAHIYPDGDCLHMSRDIEDTCKTIAKVSERDAARWKLLYSMWLDAKELTINAVNSPPGALSSYIAFLESTPDGLDQYKFDTQTLRSFCDEHFESEKTKSFLGSFAYHVATAPDVVGGGKLAWLFDCVIQDYGNRVVKGGMSNLIKATSASFTDAGGEVIADAGVSKILTENNKAKAVMLDNGDIIDVKEIVASSVDPRTLIIDLLGEETVGKAVTEKMQNYDWGLSGMVIYLALDRPLEFKSGEHVAGASAIHASGPTLYYGTQMAAECNAGLLPSSPFMLICNESLMDPSRAPEGKGLIKIVVINVPYHIRGDAKGIINATNWNDAKEAYADRVIDILNQDYITNLKQAIMTRVVHSPVDQERKVSSAVRGTAMHGTLIPYQSGVMRPIPGFGSYKSPIGNLYLCGAGCHPGPGISFMPGRNAAQVILKERGLQLPRS